MKQQSLPLTLSYQKLLFALLAAITLFVFAPQLVALSFAETTTLAWDANSESDLAGYKIYYSTNSAEGPFNGTGLSQGASPISVSLSALGAPTSPSFQLSDLVAGESYYFTISAYNDSSIESDYSNIVSYSVPLPATYSLAASAIGQGSISPTGSVSVLEGSSKAFVISADENHHIADVIVDGTSVGPVNAYSFENISAPHSIQAVFEIDSFPIIASSGENGTISSEGEASADFGSSRTYTISPAENHHIADIIVNGVSVGPLSTYTFDQINTSHSIEAIFEIDTFSIATSAKGNGTITPTGLLDVTYGSDQLCIATPDAGYQIADVKVDGKSIGAVAEYTLSNITENHVVEASFVEIITEFSMEVGEVSVGSNWQQVSFKRTFVHPVVVASALSTNDDDPAVVRIDNVTSTGFEISVQEWDYLDDDHLNETIGYIVMEAGSFTLPDGTAVEAGTCITSDKSTSGRVTLANDFAQEPVVMASVASYNDPNAITIRLRDISKTNFEYKVQEQEANTDGHHSETVSYIAWEPCRITLDSVMIEVAKTEDIMAHNYKTITFNESFATQPIFLAAMQTRDGGDTAALRWDSRSITNIQVKVEEEQSKDTEVYHTSEVAGYFAFSDKPSFDIWMSTSPDRSNPKPLNGQIISGDIYVFTTPEENIKNVTFYLNGKFHRTEGLKPYDFDGGSADANGLASATDTTIMINGKYEISTLVHLIDGSSLPEITASFQVDNKIIPLDSDQDGLSDDEEISYYGTDPFTFDTDEDNISDAEELSYWQTKWNDDFDHDGVINLLDTDSDGDALIDGDELFKGYDPADPNSRPFTLLMSKSPDRSNPVELDGQVVSGDIYIFTVPDTNVKNVTFYLNSALHRVESLNPYDFNGGSADAIGFATPWNTNTLIDGTNQITAVIQLEDSSFLLEITKTFIIANSNIH